MEEILPCPFCGANPDVREAINHDGAWCVVCANVNEQNGCEVMPRTRWYLHDGEKDGRSRAIAAWNRRSDDPFDMCSMGYHTDF